MQEAHAGAGSRNDRRDGVGVDKEAEDGIDLVRAHQLHHTPDGGWEVSDTSGFERRDAYSRLLELIRDGSPRRKARDLHFRPAGSVQAYCQFTNDGRRAADLKVGDEKEDSPHIGIRRDVPSIEKCVERLQHFQQRIDIFLAAPAYPFAERLGMYRAL